MKALKIALIASTLFIYPQKAKAGWAPPANLPGRVDLENQAQYEQSQQQFPVYTAQQVAAISQHAMQMAKTMHKEKDAEMFELAVKSSDFHHRIAAAWAYGLSLKDDSCLIALLCDQHPLVAHAARESCVYIARHKYKDLRTDFCPILNSGSNEKTDAANLWSVYFERKQKKIKETTSGSNEKKEGSK